jgi:hypothetical protein
LPRNGELLELACRFPTDQALADHLGAKRTTLRDHINREGMRDAVRSAREDRGPERPGIKRDGDSATLVSRASSDLTTPEEAMAARGLDPQEWEVKNMTVNEWDSLGPGGKPRTMRQLKLYLAKRTPFRFVFPAVETEYRAPKKWRPPNGSRLVVFVGDQQAPYQDPKLHDLFRQWLYRNRPHEGILIGDTLDLPTISRHKDNPEWHVPVQECINAGYLVLRDYVRASEGTRWQKLIGNHDERIRNELLTRAERLYRIRPADIPGEPQEEDALSIRRLLHLDALGIDLIVPRGNYTHAQIQLTDGLIVRHGWLTGANSAAASLRRLSCSIVVGHTHKQRITHRTVYDAHKRPTLLKGVETGCMCKIEDGLGYTVDPDWVNGFATATVWADGRFHIDLAQYEDGVLYWRKQRFA